MSERALWTPQVGPPRPPWWSRAVRSKSTWVTVTCGAVLVALWEAFPGREPPKIVQPEQPMPNIPYEAAQAPPQPRLTSNPQPAPQTAVAPAPAPAAGVPRIQLSMTNFGNGQFVPEYLKPAQARGQAQTQAQLGQIKYKETEVDAIHSLTVPDRTYELPAFSKIPCILDWHVVTGASGVTPFRCHVHGAVISPARVTLLEDGTVIGGYYKSVVAEGESRVTMVTAQAETPYGVIVRFQDPVGDALGGTGVPGSVDNHWGQRIGGALILSGFDAGVAIAQSALQGSGNGNQTFNFGSALNGGTGIQQVIQALLQNQIAIKPTVTLNQGQEISLLTTKMIDFSPSYRLQVRQ